MKKSRKSTPHPKLTIEQRIQILQQRKAMEDAQAKIRALRKGGA